MNRTVSIILFLLAMLMCSRYAHGVEKHCSKEDSAAITFTIPNQEEYGKRTSFSFPLVEITEQKSLENIIRDVKKQSKSFEKNFYYIKMFFRGMDIYCAVKECSQLDIEDYDGYALLDGEICFIMSREMLHLKTREKEKQMLIKIDEETPFDYCIYDPSYYLYKFTPDGIKRLDTTKENFTWTLN